MSLTIRTTESAPEAACIMRALLSVGLPIESWCLSALMPHYIHLMGFFESREWVHCCSKATLNSTLLGQQVNSKSRVTESSADRT